MGKSIFNWVANLIRTPDKRGKDKDNNPKPASNYIEKEEELLSAIKKKLKIELGYKHSNVANNYFTLWVANIDYRFVVQGDFKNTLIRKLADEGLGNTVWEIKIEDQQPQKDCYKFEKINDVFLLIEAKETVIQHVARQAKVSIIDNMGSLDEIEYILNADEKKIYHIGRGKMAKENNGYFVNDIIIKADDSNDEIKKRNALVSRSHANIVFKEGKGFYLVPMQGGAIQEKGNLTAIIHANGSREEIPDSVTHKLLQNNDIIELGDEEEMGKKVFIAFKTI